MSVNPYEFRTTVVLDKRLADLAMAEARPARISFSCMLRVGLRLAINELRLRGSGSVLAMDRREIEMPQNNS